MQSIPERVCNLLQVCWGAMCAKLKLLMAIHCRGLAVPRRGCARSGPAARTRPPWPPRRACPGRSPASQRSCSRRCAPGWVSAQGIPGTSDTPCGCHPPAMHLKGMPPSVGPTGSRVHSRERCPHEHHRAWACRKAICIQLCSGTKVSPQGPPTCSPCCPAGRSGEGSRRTGVALTARVGVLLRRSNTQSRPQHSAVLRRASRAAPQRPAGTGGASSSGWRSTRLAACGMLCCLQARSPFCCPSWVGPAGGPPPSAAHGRANLAPGHGRRGAAAAVPGALRPALRKGPLIHLRQTVMHDFGH